MYNFYNRLLNKLAIGRGLITMELNNIDSRLPGNHIYIIQWVIDKTAYTMGAVNPVNDGSCFGGFNKPRTFIIKNEAHIIGLGTGCKASISQISDTAYFNFRILHV